MTEKKKNTLVTFMSARIFNLKNMDMVTLENEHFELMLAKLTYKEQN